MAYTITITSDSPQALAFIKEAKNLILRKLQKSKKLRLKKILSKQRKGLRSLCLLSKKKPKNNMKL